jgi:hypothetical protein
MANTFAPFGFRSAGTLEGSGPTYGMTRRYLASSDTNTYFTGDVVQLSSGANPGYITQQIAGNSSTEFILGIFAGCEYYSPAVGRVVWSSYFPGNLGTSSSPCNAYTIEGEDNMFLVQCTTTAVIGTSAIGQNVGVASSLQGNGNTLNGISGVALNSSTVAATTTLPFKIVDTSSNLLPPGTNGTDGTSAGAVILVSFNNQIRRSTAGSQT